MRWPPCHLVSTRSVLQSVAVHCSVLQFVAMCCNVLQCVAVCCSVWQPPWMKEHRRINHHVDLCRHAVCCITVCCSVLQCIAVRCSMLQCVAVCCSVLQCVAVQCVAVCWSVLRRPWMKEQRRDNPHVTLCRHAARSCPQKSTISRPRSHVSLQKSPISSQKKPYPYGNVLCIPAKEPYICAKKPWRETRERERASAISLALYIRKPNISAFFLSFLGFEDPTNL